MSQHWENTTANPDSSTADMSGDRAMGVSLGRGWRSKCPQCGEGRMFSAFLKVEKACGNCGLVMENHRADDFPPYLTVTIVAHIIVPAMLVVEKLYYPEMWIHWAVWMPMTMLLTGLLMQPVKGAVVAWQWAMRMHGFDEDVVAAERRDGPDSGLPS